MGPGSHLTKEWLKLFLLQEVELAAADMDHLVSCPDCLLMLSQCSCEILDAEYPDS